MTAHVAGVPIEELVTALAGASGAMLLARCWLTVHVHDRRGAGK